MQPKFKDVDTPKVSLEKQLSWARNVSSRLLTVCEIGPSNSCAKAHLKRASAISNALSKVDRIEYANRQNEEVYERWTEYKEKRVQRMEGKLAEVLNEAMILARSGFCAPKTYGKVLDAVVEQQLPRPKELVEGFIQWQPTDEQKSSMAAR